ncbi:MAG: hypothetical protein SF187_00130 [Deltaproteobacteria bacterium]|nr:hypothetical protein [Deltaproteobacteria bacterium]
MNRRGTTIQGALAAGALAIAFMLSHTRQSIGMNEAVIVEARSSDIQTLKYFDGKRYYSVSPDPANPGDLLVHVSAGERFIARGVPPEKVPDRDLKGGQLAKDLWNAFAPLKAMRALGKLSPERRKALGLEETKRRLTVRVRGIERTYRLATPPPGAVEPYLMAEDDGSVFMVNRLIMNSFSERALGPDKPHSFGLHEFDRMTITPIGKAAIGFKNQRLEGTEAHLVSEAALQVNATSVEQWHSGAFSVPVDDALGAGETPSTGEPQVLYRLEYWLGRDRQGWMDLAKGTFRGQPRLYFRTEQSSGWLIGAAGSHMLVDQAQSLLSS